ncbi:hypothetical protein P153DRAFT_303739, partial [Dothidotthia symphoricarpi CBS 119687]
MVDALLTPNRPPPEPHVHFTRPQEVETPQQRNLRASKRQQQEAQTRAPALRSLNLGGGATNSNLVTNAITRYLNTIEQDTLLRNNVTKAMAEAIDRCAREFTDPAGAKVAAELQQRVVLALTNPPSPQTASSRRSSTAYTTTTQESEGHLSSRRSWADVARDPQDLNRGKGGNSTDNHPAKPGKFFATPASSRPMPKADPRIFVTVPAAERLSKASPFVIRQEICKVLEGVTLQDIPKAAPIRTGWAITPATDQIRTTLLTQENKELIMRALHGDSIRTP